MLIRFLQEFWEFQLKMHSRGSLLSGFVSLLAWLNDCSKYMFKKYIYTMNHKSIAINYFFFSMWSGLSGAMLATMIRMELAYPGSPFFKGDSLNYLQVVTAHGIIMVFFVVVPMLFGGFANFLIPYHVGSKDVAFPRLNSIGFWMQPVGFLAVAKLAFLRPQFWRYYDSTSFYSPLVDKSVISNDLELKENFALNLNFYKVLNEETHYLNWKDRSKFLFSNYTDYLFVPIKLFFWNRISNYPESFWFVADRVAKSRRQKVYFTKCSNRTLTTAGWTFITPFSCNTNYTGVGSQDLLILGVIFVGVSSTMSFTNLLMTRRTLSMPGLRNSRVLLPFMTMGLLLAMRMLVMITPVLAAAMFMLAADRHWQTTFFEFVYGGDTMLFNHLFWFFGHPEVYVLLMPTFGFVNMMMPYCNTSRIASKHHLIWAIYVMAYMGFVVWGHHMYLVGLDHSSRSLYSTITIMMSLPATIKLVNWTLSLLNGALKVDIAFLFSMAYILVFLVGGFTGMWLSHVGLNVSLHDTFYVVAHFHLMLSGTALTGCFAGFYYYFTAFFGIKYSRIFGYLHLVYYFGGQWLAFLPLFWVGTSGLPRRVHDYPVMFAGWQTMSTTGHFITVVGVTFFFLMILDSHFEKKLSTPSCLGVPSWHKRTLYYIFKIRYLQNIAKKLSRMPTSEVRLHFANNSYNEYEFYDITMKSK